jgi:hypothetical protein
MSTAPDSPVAPAEPRRLSSLFGNIELTIAILLGLVSITTAYASFQAALYDSQMAGAYTRGQNLATAAESLYLEGNQQFIQDTQLWNTLTELSIEMDGPDAAAAQLASDKFDTLYFMSVSDELGSAIVWSDEQNQADPDVYTSPFDSEDYMAFLFSGWADTQEEADAAVAAGDEYNSLSDRLTLNTVLMAISLFLLGVAAVVRQRKVQFVLIGTSMVIFVLAAALTAFVPFVGL